MHTQNLSVQALTRAAPQNASYENVARAISMTSLELVDFINVKRQEIGDGAVLRHDHLMAKVPKVLKKDAPQFRDIYKDAQNRTQDCYRFPKREACLMAMSYSYELQAAVYDHMTDLEERLSGRVIATLPDFTNPVAAARAWADEMEQKQIAQEALAIAAPKVEFVDKYVDSTGLKGFRQTAKLLKANESRFREFLIDKRIMYRLGGEWQAYQNHIDAGRFDVKTGTSDGGHAYNQAKFTPKGVTWVAGLWAQHNLEAQ